MNASVYSDSDGGEDQDSVFKKMYKKYRNRNSSLCGVLQPRIDIDNFEQLQISTKQYKSESWISRLGLRPIDRWKCVTLKGHKGLYILPDIIEDPYHLQWFSRCVNNYTEPPGFTNVHLHFPNARKIFQDYKKKLRWTTLGFHYNWDTKIYPDKGEPLPEELVSFGNLVAHVLGLGTFHPDAAIINFFPTNGKLGPHTDHSERDLGNPLLSLSLGQSAVYLTGGNDLNSPVTPLLLQSGDALVMHDNQRLVYHAVPSIRTTRKFEMVEGIDSDVRDYANNHRISLTLRQVEFGKKP